MTETTSRTQPATGTTPPVRPMDILLNLVVTLLTPMFLIDSGGDLTFARMAALETVNSYSARDPMELITIARIIGFGLAALGSLALSMADDTPPLMMLRWRCNANALNRSAEQSRRALQASRLAATECAGTEYAHTAGGNAAHPGATWAEVAPDADQARYEAQVLADLAQTQQRVAEAKARQAASDQAAQAVAAAPPVPVAAPALVAAPDQATPSSLPAAAPVAATLPLPTPAPAPAMTAPAMTAPAMTAPAMTAEERYRAVFATAMAEVAAEFTAELDDLSPHQRKEAMVQAAALSSSANELLSGPSMPWPPCATPPSNPVE
ncbi:hypothetical protein [Rhodopila sp.]|uniref:hypothetical protein n=1 Tax=Rhodopila sp. TaxID=2480087 RepID=UPI003D112A2E